MKGVLGQAVAAPQSYAPEILERIARPERSVIGCFGWDIWHCYELSWVVEGAVQDWVGVLAIPAESPATVESKSLKLYLNSLNGHCFEHDEAAIALIERDVSTCIGSPVRLSVLRPDGLAAITDELQGVILPPCPASVPPETMAFTKSAISPGKEKIVSQHLVSHSLRSLCPVTAQPDWASLSIQYSGPEIDHDALSEYLSSFRTHQGFHEQCVEQIYADLMSLGPASLTVTGYYQRRGGIDITPWRSSEPLACSPQRLGRQ